MEFPVLEEVPESADSVIEKSSPYVPVRIDLGWVWNSLRSKVTNIPRSPGVGKDIRSIERAAAEILHAAFPNEYQSLGSSIRLERLSGAMSNVIYVCRSAVAGSRPLLLRIYGTGTNSLFSRKREVRIC